MMGSFTLTKLVEYTGFERAHCEPLVPALRFLDEHGALWRKRSQICAGYFIFAVGYELFFFRSIAKAVVADV
jgi:uncharacterized membrane protein